MEQIRPFQRYGLDKENQYLFAEWVRLRAGDLSAVLPGTLTRFPSAATYSNVLRAADAAQVSQVLNNWLIRVATVQRYGDEPSRLLWQAEQAHDEPVALDGKARRGTRAHQAADQRPMHQLTLSETQTGVIGQEQVTGEQQNAWSLMATSLTPALVKERIISADALHTQRGFCRRVTDWEGDYVLLAKDHQATLADDLRLFFTQPPADCQDWRTARTIDKGHGHQESRELVATAERNDFLAGQWAGGCQVFQVTRTVRVAGRTRTEVVSGLTSLAPARASAARLLHLVREQRVIENRLHWRRDVTLREEHSQVRKGDAPRVLAILNSFLMERLTAHG